MDGYLIVHKEPGMTSHGVVSRLRRILGEKKIGHAGTLDPMASGVLFTMIGAGTKAAFRFEGHDKAYRAKFLFGIRTNTGDVTGETLEESPVLPGCEEISRAAKALLGKSLQIPPMVSAIKKDGKKLYELARKGIEIEREPREITIHEIEVLGCDGREMELFVRCSKGTYLRTLGEDVAKACGALASLSSLVREQSGGFSLGQAKTLGEIEALHAAGKLGDILLPVDSAFLSAPALFLSPEEERRYKNGARVLLSSPPSEELLRVYGAGGKFLAAAQAVSDGEGFVLKPVRNFFQT